MSGSTRSTRSTPMTTGAVPPAVKTFVTEYTVRMKNDLVDMIPDVVNEALRVADVSDAPKIAENVEKLTSQVKKDVDAEVAKGTAEIPTLVRSALEDYQLSRGTRDDDRLEAAKKDLLNWFQENLRNEVAPLVSEIVKPFVQTTNDLSAKVTLLQRDLAVLLLEQGEAPYPTAKCRSDHASDGNVPENRASGNLTRATPGGIGGSDDDSSCKNHKSRRSSRKDRNRSRRDHDREERRREYSSDDADSSSSSCDNSDRDRRVSSFRPWKPTDHRFHKACDYRTYRLEQGRGQMDSRTNRNTRKKVKDLEVTMAGHKFDGKDPIKILGFLRRLKRDADRNDMTENSLYLALPYMLRGEAQDAFEAAQDDGNSRRNVQDWTTACDWLLRTYATNANIADTLLDLSRTRQGPEEDETKFSTRLRNAVKRCGNVHSEYEVATLFVQGLNPTISPRVAQERSRRPRIEYVDLVQFARSEGDAVRAQGRLGKSRASLADKLPRRTVHFVSDDAEGSRSTMTRGESADADAAEVNLLGDCGQSVSAPSYLSAAETESTEAEALYAGQARFPKNRFDRYRRDPPSQGNSMAICYECYLPGHIAPRCEMKLKDLHQIPTNYRKLTEEQKTRVPNDSYLRAVAALKLPVEEVKPADPKN